MAKVIFPTTVRSVVAAVGVELILLDKSEATGQMWDDAAATVGVAAPGIGAGGGGKISVLSEAFTGVT